MRASQSTSTTRRTILRFDLASISIDDRPNVYKKPQLVLKPQLELAPRRPYTGSRPRMPVWRHFLMVHVKDKADELVKLDLDTFKPSQVDVNTVLRHSITCLFSSCALLFRYSMGKENGSSTLSITLQKPSDLDTVLRELGALSINVEHEQTSRQHSLVHGTVPSELWAPPGQSVSQIPRSFSNPRQLNNSSPPLASGPNSQGGYPAYLETHPYGTLLQRPPSHPLGQSASALQPGQRPWSPAFVPSRPATTLGVPGILGEGIYKVSKIGSTVSSRPRVRRTSTILEQQGHGLYTVSRHFDKTLSRADILHSSGSRHLGRGLSSGLPGADAVAPRTPSALEGVQSNMQHQPRLRRLRTTNDTLNPSLPAGLDDTQHQTFLSSVAEQNTGSAFSQPEPVSRDAGSIDDAHLFSSSPTLIDSSMRQGMENDWLLRVSQIQHQGLCEANRVWDDFMERGGSEVALAESSEDAAYVLSKLEDDFTRRWEGVVAATTRRMREI
ncbi:hypothetical protein C8A00DRAFT_42519 [Chaetomidium leptoderma]|uniref:Uncharacterized protein n=1 Tax=Chaetomidium leptoderma TaxID=669021 RepID=A0AAN6ZYD6_9PEZI|nr:hypothetical protein C8A00DRAFT_42519 [Chaetomidium leptoderma]